MTDATHAADPQPAIAEVVTYMRPGETAVRRPAVIIGHPTDPAYADDAHLAVLDEGGASLDVIALSVPRDERGAPGTWHYDPTGPAATAHDDSSKGDADGEDVELPFWPEQDDEPTETVAAANA